MADGTVRESDSDRTGAAFSVLLMAARRCLASRCLRDLCARLGVEPCDAEQEVMVRALSPNSNLLFGVEGVSHGAIVFTECRNAIVREHRKGWSRWEPLEEWHEERAERAPSPALLLALHERKLMEERIMQRAEVMTWWGDDRRVMGAQALFGKQLAVAEKWSVCPAKVTRCKQMVVREISQEVSA